MTYYLERIQQTARNIALEHITSEQRISANQFWRSFNESSEKMRSFVDSLHKEPCSCGQLAEEWLLDNAEFIEEQIYEMKVDLNNQFLKKLPTLASEQQTRIESIISVYIDEVDGIIHDHSLIAFINAYQEISALSLSEIRSIPLIFRKELIERFSITMDAVRERKQICKEVESFLAELDPVKMDAHLLSAQLEKAGQAIPLSGPWIPHLIGHLREWADDNETVREWLICRYENGVADLDKLVTYEHQLQANYQVAAGNYVTSLRQNERRAWHEVFEKISTVQQKFEKESTGDYSLLDEASRNIILTQVEKLAERMHVTESLVAEQAINLADGVWKENQGQSSLPRAAFIAYYLLDSTGIKQLEQALKNCCQPKVKYRLFVNARRGYFTALIGLFVLLFFGFYLYLDISSSLAWWQWVVILLGIDFLAGEWVVFWLHFIIESFFRPKPLLRYEFSKGIPEEATSLVVIPVIWSTSEEVLEIVNKLELHYLSCRKRNIHFALLSDFADAKKEVLTSDEQLVKFAREQIAQLNERYQQSGSLFFLFQRNRQWNATEETYMGWERKRGKLIEFVELLKGKKDTSYQLNEIEELDTVIVEENQQITVWEVLNRVRYIITLDADTELPMGNAERMIATMHLPYNRPRLNQAKTRVIEGYGIMQPRIGISHTSSLQSKLAYFWTEAGLDPYAFAATDPYHDALDHGIFTGKGIFDVDAFVTVLGDRMPDNLVLSHDLLEGGFLRTGFLADIELIDDHPNRFSAYQKRMHRWARGDWQLLRFLFPYVKNRSNQPQKVDLSTVSRWQILDNLRRSLLPIIYMGLLILVMASVLDEPKRWLVLIFITLLLPFIKQVICLIRGGWNTRGVICTVTQILISIWVLPFQAATLLHALLISLYRQFISKKHLLEWTSSSQIDRLYQRSHQPVLLGLVGGYLFIALFASAIFFQSNFWLKVIGFMFSIFWLIAPLVIQYLDQPFKEKKLVLAEDERNWLLKLAEDIWEFYQVFANETENWLPPDNIQIEPDKGVAHRTSPTNIGFLLTATLAAKDFAFINEDEFLERVTHVIDTVEKLEKWRGHLYNWYDTRTLAPLPPKYVSTVDSGNFVASLMTLKQGLVMMLESLEADHEDSTKAAFTDNTRLTMAEIRQLIVRVEGLIGVTDFRELYDDKAKLFILGYNGQNEQRDEILYDLMASEARQTSFVAIALGQIPVAHWLKLGRTTKKQNQFKTLVSWSGTMFEYMMPWLIMKTYTNTIWESTYQGVVKKQIDYAHQHHLPFGISESGYFAFDYQMNYQYRAFGVPDLGFKRDLDRDLVLAPYATIMALPYALQTGLSDLKQMEILGARGQFGFFEAIDFTPERMPIDHEKMIVQSFMTHHQGMSLLTIANLILPTKMYDYFHHDKRVQSVELLLKERIPTKVSLTSRKFEGADRLAVNKEPEKVFGREIHTFNREKEINIHSNGRLTSVINHHGGGYLQYEDKAISRWREGSVGDNWGSFFYIKDTAKNHFWSPSHQPCKAKHNTERTVFSLDKSTFSKNEDHLQSELTICVSPEVDAEFRHLKLSNLSNEEKELEITTYLELVLAPTKTDEAHPAFSKLFIETEYDKNSECLLARKRPRHADEKPLWAFQVFLAVDATGDLKFETDRRAFIGRGNQLTNPQGLTEELKGTTGAVVDPAFVLQRKVKIAAGETEQLTMITGVAESREKAVEIARKLSYQSQVDKAFQLAWNRSQIELKYFHLSQSEVTLMQQLASQLLYNGSFSKDRKQAIATNQLGKKELWSLGISGDRPVVLITIADISNLTFLKKMIMGHEYLRRNGLIFDFVFLNDAKEGYQQNAHETISRMIEFNVTNRDNCHVLSTAHLDQSAKNLLFAIARIVLKADGRSLKSQLRSLGKKSTEWSDQQIDHPLPDLSVHKNNHEEKKEVVGVSTKSDMLNTESLKQQLQFFNGIGGFANDGKEYHILSKKQIPAVPWINVLANPTFGTIISDGFTGYTWWRNSRECKLTPWSNDQTLDTSGEICYLKDEDSGALWKIGLDQKTQATFGHGYAKFNQQVNGISQDMTVFVPIEDAIKIMKLELKNETAKQRKISISYFADWVIDVQAAGHASFIETKWLKDHHTLMAQNHLQESFRDAHAFLTMVSDQNNITWTGDRDEFFGNGDEANPQALVGIESLSNQTGVFQNTCGVISTVLTLEANSVETIYILLGCGNSESDVERLVDHYQNRQQCEKAFSETTDFWEKTLTQISVETPSSEMNIMLNGWLLYQTLACRIWARSAFYQAGGAYGYRDQLQDSLAVLHTRPMQTRAQIILHAEHQYLEGDVQHWWHEETGYGIRTLFSDDLLWLPYALLRYLEHTGDKSILTETTAYLTSEPLKEDEHERYEKTVVSTQTGTILEHCLKAIDRSLKFGEHGLPLMGIGDWNDGMSRIGAKGRGESVWLGWFLGNILQKFIGLCEEQGDGIHVESYQTALTNLKEALNQNAWDGNWFRRAFTDHGDWLGSHENDECRIDAIAQSWSVISQLASIDKAQTAMQSFDQFLVDRDLGVAKILTPGFDKTTPSPGYIQGYPPGIRENGAQYTHGVIWSILAWCRLQNGDKAFELFDLLNPVNHGKTIEDVQVYGGEPYVMAADVYTQPPHKGHAGWTWYTGASGWMYQVGIEGILGIKRCSDQLLITPCIPSGWSTYTVNYRYENSIYQITVKNPSQKMTGCTSLIIDGQEVSLNAHGEACIPLEDENRIYRIELIM